MVFQVLRAIAVTATVCGIAYWSLSIWCARRFLAKQRKPFRRHFTPPVSILKPLYGLEPQAYESLRSHCVQDYPGFEIIFGVRDPEDPIVPTVERLMREFPQIPMRLVVCPKALGMNFKVSNLIQMLPEARHSYVVINDSDIHAPPDYLRRVIEPLQDNSIGMVTCLYRGSASATLGSKLESLAIGSDFMPGVLFARELEGGVYFALGSTLAFPRRALEAIGGLEGVVDHLADDYELGHRMSTSGLRVVIADCIVDHHLPPYSMRTFLQHQLRWGRTVRDARPAGYAGLIFTFVFPWSILALAFSRGTAFGWSLLASALIVRFAVSGVFELQVLKGRHVLRDLWLIPIRDLIAVAVWVVCYMGRRVVWRGNTFELAKGKLRPWGRRPPSPGVGGLRSQKKLIVSADDFGLTERLNDAILLAHRSGIVTSASLMVNGGAFESAAAIARRNPSLDLGLHVNLTEGQPVSDASIIPTLAGRHGFLHNHPIKLWVALWTRRVRLADVETETRAQLEKALNAGVAITHIDGHKHVHAAPPVLDCIVRIARDRGIKAVRPVMESTPGLLSLIARNKAASVKILKQYLSGVAMSASFRMSARRGHLHGMAAPSRFYGVTQTGFLDLDAFAAIVRGLSAGVSEIMCHPGYVDADLERTPTRLRVQRERELQLLTGREARALIKQENVELIGYKDLVSFCRETDEIASHALL